MPKQLEYVTCPSCGATVAKGKFCPECGSLLKDAQPAPAPQTKPVVQRTFAPYGFPPPGSLPVVTILGPGEAPKQPQGKALSDEGLTLLVDACKKTLATLAGDGHNEIVLYVDEATGKYWLHTYVKDVCSQQEIHASYIASPELAQKVFAYIEEHDLASWNDRKGFPMCGGDIVLRFKHGEEYIRLDSSKLADMQAYADIRNMLYAEATEANKRYADA